MDRQWQINYHRPSVFMVLQTDSTSIPLNVLLNQQASISEAIKYVTFKSFLETPNNDLLLHTYRKIFNTGNILRAIKIRKANWICHPL